MWYLKLILVAIFAVVLYQDFASRLVYWFLYPLIGILAFAVQLNSLPIEIALANLGCNLLFVGIILAISMIYLRFRKLDLKNMFGIGDLLFFLFITATFSMVSFVILFVFSLVFSLVLHVVLNLKKEQSTVPLAGYMSLFFGVVYLVTFYFSCTFLYAY